MNATIDNHADDVWMDKLQWDKREQMIRWTSKCTSLCCTWAHEVELDFCVFNSFFFERKEKKLNILSENYCRLHIQSTSARLESWRCATRTFLYIFHFLLLHLSLSLTLFHSHASTMWNCAKEKCLMGRIELCNCSASIRWQRKKYKLLYNGVRAVCAFYDNNKSPQFIANSRIESCRESKSDDIDTWNRQQKFLRIGLNRMYIVKCNTLVLSADAVHFQPLRFWPCDEDD